MPIDLGRRQTTGWPVFIESIDEDMAGVGGMPGHDLHFSGGGILLEVIPIEQEGAAWYA